jgi:SAM-dependent MidA family methyltransferase
LNPVADKIRAEIAECGAICFTRFMELALYCPDCGFYEKENDSIGRRGNFYTSVSVGPLFGELLGFQFAGWLAQRGTRNAERATPPMQIVEAGAHDGRLARDILNWLRLRRPALFEQIEYGIVEPSARRQKRQRETLDEFAPRVRWAADLGSLSCDSSGAISNPRSAICNPQFNGLIFSNELLDAMPVHRLGWDARRCEWFEWGVADQRGKFVWTRLANTPHAPGITLPPELLAVLPDGFTTEICPAAENWWREAAGLLQNGRLLTIDYGLRAEEFFAPQRVGGTLRAYHRHRLCTDALANAGEQDLTAQVNFSAIQAGGEAAGLKTELLETQAHFLTDIARRAWDESSGFGPWTPAHTRQFETLTHPEYLGRPFRILIQAR